MLEDDNDELKDALVEGSELETIVVANTESDKKEGSAKPSQKPRKPWTTFEVRQREELRRLRAEVDTLKDKLRRMNHSFLRAGLFDRTEDFTKAELKFEANGSVIYQLVTHMKLPAPRDVVMATIWGVIAGSQSEYLPLGLTETFEQIDASTVYSRIVDSRDLAVRWHSNLIRKLYREPDRDVLVVRTVLDDSLVPQMSVDFVENKWAWGQVTTLDENSCNVTLLIQIGLNEISSDPSAVQCAINTTNRMNKTFPSSLTVKEGDFPIVPTLFDVDFTQIEHPSLRVVLENGKRIRDAMNFALHKVIQRKT
ncbi:hypothetical protein Ae201684P_021328 [Aphanomyces euteiches]|nr:hypothetical protein Ae201684P_021328 [Aphanomyces euteiches]